MIVAGIVYPHKGINMPGFSLPFSGITSKDKRDLEFVFKYKPDFIAQSFVRNHKDVLHLRRFIGNRLPNCKIISKVENQEAVDNIDKIIKASDLVMIARGDMGISLPIYKVPIVQKMIIKRCKLLGKKVIVATQMLESMTQDFMPTRAEVSDVANAILDGSDYLMLSGETAKGRYPAQSVRMMNEIIKYTERSSLVKTS